jgi:type IV pilus assembly protein PilN
MRNIEKSPWMGQVSLSQTENTHLATRMPYTFGLTVTLSRPKQDDSSSKVAPAAKPKAHAATAEVKAPAKHAPAAASTVVDKKAAEPSVSVSPVQSSGHQSPSHDAVVKGGAKS